MTGLGRFKNTSNDRRSIRFGNDDDVSIFAAGADNRLLEGDSVATNFPLLDNTLIIDVEKFNRLFNGDDIGRPSDINFINKSMHGRRLAGSVGTSNQH